MQISGDYMSAPGVLDKAKAAQNNNRQVFAFTVSTKDIERELKVFANALGKDLLNELKAGDTIKRVEDRARNDLFSKAPQGSSRVQKILSAMRKDNRYKVTNGKPAKVTGATKNVRMQIFNINVMDKETNIGILDKENPQEHIAPFATGSLVKQMSSPARRYRAQKRFALWRMFEYRTKKAYAIPKVAKGPMKFTSDTINGYSSWIISRRVNWNTKGSRGVANMAYYLLNESRTIYKRDKRTFSFHIGKGINKIIRTKTRFH